MEILRSCGLNISCCVSKIPVFWLDYKLYLPLKTFELATETLGEKVNRVLDYQKAFFSIVSKLMGDVAQLLSNVAQISRNIAEIAMTLGSGIGFSAVGDRVGLQIYHSFQG